MAVNPSLSNPPDLSIIRNIGILAHIDAGKTSVTEKILCLAGIRDVAGSVDDGTTATDYLDVERRRGITVKAAAVSFEWKNRQIHLIDTPGHVDFGAEVSRSVRALDGAVILICAVSGVQSRTEILVRGCESIGLPRIYFVNKMDRRCADFEACVAELENSIEPGIVPVQIPWIESGEFLGIIDLATLEAVPSDSIPETLNYHTIPDNIKRIPCPSSMLVMAEHAQTVLIERLSDTDPSIMKNYIEGIPVSGDAIRQAIRFATVSRKISPVFCGTAFDDSTVAELMDAIVSYLPSPFDAGGKKGKHPKTNEDIVREPGIEVPFSALVFKGSTSLDSGFLSWSRIWSGRVRRGDRVMDSARGTPAKIKNIFRMQADSLLLQEEAFAGDIVALEFSGSDLISRPGSTLSDLNYPIVYETAKIADPVVTIAIEPKDGSDSIMLSKAIGVLVAEDSSLSVSEDLVTGRMELSGQGELHLEIALDRLSRESGLRLKTGKPAVVYKETVSSSFTLSERFDREILGEQVQASITVSVMPVERGHGVVVSLNPGLRLPGDVRDAIVRGIESTLSMGPVFGFSLIDIKVNIEDAGMSDSRGKAGIIAIEAVSSIATRACIAAARPVLLEPWMHIDIETSSDVFGSVTALVLSRSGRIESIDESTAGVSIGATAPMRLLFGFATALRSGSGGRAVFQARFKQFELAPPGYRPA